MNLSSILDLIFPSQCVTCARPLTRGASVCDDCFGRIPIHTALLCGQCGARMAQGVRTCHKDHPYVLGAASEYQEETVRSLIHALKFNAIENAAEPLAKLLIRHMELTRMEWGGAVAVPVPLSARRLRTRGFNQSERIARRVADRFSLTLRSDLLVRTRHTAPQSDLADFGKRAENIRGAFLVPREAACKGMRLVLVDDVTTSGHTFFEAARALKTAGARSVLALAVARAS